MYERDFHLTKKKHLGFYFYSQTWRKDNFFFFFFFFFVA